MLTAKKKYGFDPQFAVPPGRTLKEVMESFDMTQKELSDRTGLTVQSLNRIFNGKQPITYETANRLELATSVPARMWNNLESQYREQLEKLRQKNQLEEELDWLKTIPVKELVHRNAISLQSDKTLQLREVLKFYGVSGVGAWKKIWANPEVRARRSRCFETCPGPASAWIRMGELAAHSVQCKKYDKHRFGEALKRIRRMTVKDEFLSEMTAMCAESGVALVFVSGMKKVPWHGATKWLSPSKAMILLNLRGKAEDQFWFSFFHEAGHILGDSKKDLYINDDSEDDPCERRANEFAAEMLIPRKHDSEIMRFKSKQRVLDFAEKLNISPGIVVGRFQHLTKKWNYFNELKRKFQLREQ